MRVFLNKLRVLCLHISHCICAIDTGKSCLLNADVLGQFSASCLIEADMRHLPAYFGHAAMFSGRCRIRSFPKSFLQGKKCSLRQHFPMLQNVGRIRRRSHNGFHCLLGPVFISTWGTPAKNAVEQRIAPSISFILAQLFLRANMEALSPVQVCEDDLFISAAQYEANVDPT